MQTTHCILHYTHYIVYILHSIHSARIHGVTTHCSSNYHRLNDTVTIHVTIKLHMVTTHPLLGPLGTNHGNKAPNNNQNIVKIGNATFSESIGLSLFV